MSAENTPSSDAQARLLEAAEVEFAEKGLNGTTVREICRRANVNIASINYYFGDKDRLYVEAVKHAHVCSMEGGALPPLPSGMPPLEKLKAFIREMVRRMFLPASPTSLQLMMREMAHPTAAGREIVREYIQPTAFALRSILQELLPEMDERALVMTGFGVIGQVLFYRQNRAGRGTDLRQGTRSTRSTWRR